jgi:hypothetical protein
MASNMRSRAPNASPRLAAPDSSETAAERRHPRLLQQVLVAFVLVLMGGLGAALLLAAAVMAGYE